MDTSVPRSMKSAAKCDNSREPQSPVTRRIFERTMRRGVLPRRVRSSVANQRLRPGGPKRLRNPTGRRVGSSARRARPRISSNSKGKESLATGERPPRAGDVLRGGQTLFGRRRKLGTERRKPETGDQYPPVCPLVHFHFVPPPSAPELARGLPIVLRLDPPRNANTQGNSFPSATRRGRTFAPQTIDLESDTATRRI